MKVKASGMHCCELVLTSTSSYLVAWQCIFIAAYGKMDTPRSQLEARLLYFVSHLNFWSRLYETNVPTKLDNIMYLQCKLWLGVVGKEKYFSCFHTVGLAVLFSSVQYSKEGEIGKTIWSLRRHQWKTNTYQHVENNIKRPSFPLF